jgi:hypothetical protein
MDIQAPSVGQLDCLPSCDLLMIQRCSAGDEEVDFQLGRLMDQIGGGAPVNRVPEGVDVER